MTIYYNGSNIQSLKINPFLGLILENDYTNYPQTKEVSTFQTINSIKTSFGIFILQTIINEFNNREGTSYDYNDFGIVNIPVDQNSRCSYLIFPLKTDIDILIRTYVQLGEQVSLDFNELGFVPKPNYVF